jgi:hypothetical protein
MITYRDLLVESERRLSEIARAREARLIGRPALDELPWGPAYQLGLQPAVTLPVPACRSRRLAAERHLVRKGGFE